MAKSVSFGGTAPVKKFDPWAGYAKAERAAKKALAKSRSAKRSGGRGGKGGGS